MNAIQAVDAVRAIQYALLTIATLHLTAHYWPKNTKLENGQAFDFIIVGAGTAGNVVATRLVEDSSKTVLLIEAGGDAPFEAELPALFPYLEDSVYDWNFTAQNDGLTAQYHKNKQLFLSQGRMLGGSSSLNYLVYNRGAPHDYDTWAEVVKDDSWKYENLMKYFKKSERLEDEAILNSPYRDNHGLHGNIGFKREPNPISKSYVEAFVEIGFKMILDTSGYLLGYGMPLFVISDGVRQSSAYSYLRLVKDVPNLYLARHSQAIEIVFDDENKAIGVKVLTAEGDTLTVYGNKEIIVSAGAFNSPKLLMLSGIGPEEHLKELGIPCRSNLPVGRNFQDHVGTVMLFKMGKAEPQKPPNPHHFPLNSALGYVTLNENQSYPDYQGMSFVIDDPDTLLKICSFVFKFDDFICNTFYNESIGHQMFFGIPNDLHPYSRGEVLLRSSDPKDPPIIKAFYMSDFRDLARIVEILPNFYGVINSTFFKESNAEFVQFNWPNCPDTEFGTERFWVCHAWNSIVSLSNFCGTCSMGSVVDNKLRVLGVSNLRVIDASIMPNITGGATYAPTVMIGEKGAAMIMDEHGMSNNDEE